MWEKTLKEAEKIQKISKELEKIAQELEERANLEKRSAILLNTGLYTPDPYRHTLGK